MPPERRQVVRINRDEIEARRPDAKTREGRRERAILAVLPYHGLRRAELCALDVGDLQERYRVKHLRNHIKPLNGRDIAVNIEDAYVSAGGARHLVSSLRLRPGRMDG